MVAALLLLQALATRGASNGSVLLQPCLEGFVMRLILYQPRKQHSELKVEESHNKISEYKRYRASNEQHQIRVSQQGLLRSEC